MPAILRDSKFFERFLMAVVLISLASFAYYFTEADIEEVESGFNNRRMLLGKMLAREVADLLERRADLTPRLANLLAQESIAYAAVQQADGAVLARVESQNLSLAVLEQVEEKALTSNYLRLIPYRDTSRTIALMEVTVPVIMSSGKKVVLRLGFFRGPELLRVSFVRFRNSLMFSVAMLALGAYWFVRKSNSSNLQSALLGGTAVIMLLLFLSTRMTLQTWYDTHWRESFVRQGLSLSKVVAVSAVRFIETGDEKDLQEVYRKIMHDENVSYVAVARDEQIIYHSDPEQIGVNVGIDENYQRSLNSEQPILFRLQEPELYETMIPLMKGRLRLGTLIVGLRSQSHLGPLNVYRTKQFMIFISGLLVMLFMLHLLARRVSKEVGSFIRAMEHATAGDLRQQIYIDRNDEFGQMAHAFNFMLMSMKERDMIGRGLQQYVSRSVVERTLKALSGTEQNGEKLFAVSAFIYFSGIEEAINRVEGTRIFSAVQECYASAKKIAQSGQHTDIQLFPSGILILFTYSNRHDALLRSLNIARLLARDLGRRPEMPFAPKVTLHAMEMIRGQIAENAAAFIGDSFADYRALARIQDSDEVLASREVQVLLKDVVEVEELEVLSSEQGRMSAYLIKSFKETTDLINAFSGSTSWTKIMILRILKNGGGLSDPACLFEWYNDEDLDVRYQVMDVIERFKTKEVADFVVSTLVKEQEPKVLSRAIAVLGKVGGEEHIPILSEKLRSADRRVKANAVEALEAIGGKRVYEFLNLLVDEQDNRVKANILIALGKYGDLKVFDLLSRMIKDSEPNMRASAAYALGRLGMAQGVEPLISALSDKDPMVCRQVVASLTALKADLDIDY